MNSFSQTPAYSRRGAPIPGPSSYPTGNGQVASYNLVGGLPVFAGWITPGDVVSAGKSGGQTIIGGTASGDDLTLKGEAGDAALIVSASGHVCTVRQTASVPGLLLVGPGRTGGTDATNGISQFLSFNQPSNRQLTIGPSDGWGNASVRFFRLAYVSGTAAMDAITGAGQRADMMFGTSTSNVTFGADALGPSTAKAYFGCEAAKVGQVVRASVSQSSNLQEWQLSGGTVAAAIGPKGTITPASLADADAPNHSIYYSTDASKMVYKDSAGTVNALY